MAKTKKGKKETAKEKRARLAAEAEAAAEDNDDESGDSENEDDDDDGDDTPDNGDDLFDKPRNSKEGDFWPAKTGTYVGEIARFEKGPIFDNKEKDGSVTKRATVRWVFTLFKLSSVEGVDKPVTYKPESGENEGKKTEAEGDGLTSTIVSQKSSAGKWFSAALNREIDFDDESQQSLMEESIGERVLVTYSKNDNGKITIGAGGVASLPTDEDEDDEDDDD